MKLQFNRVEDELGVKVTVTNKDTNDVIGYITNDPWCFSSLGGSDFFTGNNRVNVERQIRKHYV